MAFAALVPPATAMDFELGNDTRLRVNGAMTFGTVIRAEAWDPAVIGVLSSARVGAPFGQLAGNAGGSNLNFQKGHPVSTVAKGLVSVEVQRQSVGLFLRAKGWYDEELERGNRPYGNAPNGFTQNVPLSDSGFDANARFTNVVVDEANIFGKFDLGGARALELRLGRQAVHWGVAQLMRGLNTINPADLPAMLRPGALPEEGQLPVGMGYARLALNGETSVEAWIPYEFRPTVLPGCGTFYSSNILAAPGCNYVSVLGTAGVNDPVALSTGQFPKRRPDQMAKKSGQFGLSATQRINSIGAQIHAYVARQHSLLPSVRVINPDINGGYGNLSPNPTRLTDPNGLNWAMTFPENIDIFGLAGSVDIDSTTQIHAELGYRPNQPLNLNTSDVIAAFLRRTPSSALNLAKGTNAIPPAGIFDAYDRYKVTSLIVGAHRTFKNVAGAQGVTLLAELGWSHVSGLPDPGRLRYGRSDDYGLAQVTSGTPCVDTTAAQKNCAVDGFVTANAWGYRVRAAAVYPASFFGAIIKPSITFTHNVKGYSHDTTLSQGRIVLETALRAEWEKQYFTGAAYSNNHGGRYNSAINRNVVSIFAGMRF